MVKKMNEWMLKMYVRKETFKHHLSQFWGNERGAGTVEYAMVIAVVVILMIVAASAMQGPVQTFFLKVIDKIKTQAKV